MDPIIRSTQIIFLRWELGFRFYAQLITVLVAYLSHCRLFPSFEFVMNFVECGSFVFDLLALDFEFTQHIHLTLPTLNLFLEVIEFLELPNK